jgi:TM2 domain-containing membrane protein YozV
MSIGVKLILPDFERTFSGLISNMHRTWYGLGIDFVCYILNCKPLQPLICMVFAVFHDKYENTE